MVHLHAIDAGYSTAHEPSTGCQSETALPTSEESHAATPVSPSKGRRCSIPVVAPPIAPAMVGAVAVVWPIVRVAPIVILAIVVVSVIGLPIIVASVVGLAVVTGFSHSIHFHTDYEASKKVVQLQVVSQKPSKENLVKKRLSPN